MNNSRSNVLVYEGANVFRTRIVLSLLSKRPVRIRNIRSDDETPGLREHEASFLRLIDKLTNGSTIQINETGTSVYFGPGVPAGGEVEHACSNQRSLYYYLEGVVMFAPFSKQPLSLTLHGVTEDNIDPSVDIFRFGTLPLLKMFGIDEGLDFKVIKRGPAPAGGGTIKFSCPITRAIKPFHWLDVGKVKRVRGMAYTTGVAPTMANRLVDGARSVLNAFLPDVYISTEHFKGDQFGGSPGFGISLIAETNSNFTYSAGVTSPPQGQGLPTVAEDLGKLAAQRLLQEIYKGGCVDSTHQSLALLFMVLCSMDTSRLVIGHPSPHTVKFLRHINDFFNLMFKISPVDVPEAESELQLGSGERFVFTCAGVGFSNIHKTTL